MEGVHQSAALSHPALMVQGRTDSRDGSLSVRDHLAFEPIRIASISCGRASQALTVLVVRSRQKVEQFPLVLGALRLDRERQVLNVETPEPSVFHGNRDLAGAQHRVLLREKQRQAVQGTQVRDDLGALELLGFCRRQLLLCTKTGWILGLGSPLDSEHSFQ